jgi:sugar phosphate isomerase/epimerase
MITQLSRRQFVKSSLLAATALSAKSFAWAQGAADNIQIGVQLYSLRDDCEKNFDAALAQVARMGFAGVEFAGYYKYDGKAKALRKKLDELNLKAEGTHIGADDFRGDRLQRTIDFHHILGCRFLIVPIDDEFTSPERSQALAELFNQTAEKLKPAGMACGFHNHTGEFKKTGEGTKTYWDLFAERTSKDVVLQQDCGWSAAARQNPAELVRRYPGRTKTTHFKPFVLRNDKTKKAILGQDSVDWVSVLAACREVGGTEWVVVEQEFYPDGMSPMECTALSLAGLKKIWQARAAL